MRAVLCNTNLRGQHVLTPPRITPLMRITIGKRLLSITLCTTGLFNLSALAESPTTGTPNVSVEHPFTGFLAGGNMCVGR